MVFLGRAIRSYSSATISGNSIGATTYRRLPELTFCGGTCSNLNPQWRSQNLVGYLSFLSLSVARSVAEYSSASATSLAQDVHTKETPRAEAFSPKDVVLYQYAACPFCNKVKGQSSISFLANVDFGLCLCLILFFFSFYIMLCLFSVLFWLMIFWDFFGLHVENNISLIVINYYAI